MKAMFETFPDCHVDNGPYPIQFGSGDWTTVITRTKGTFTGKMVLPGGKVIAPTGNPKLSGRSREGRHLQSGPLERRAGTKLAKQIQYAFDPVALFVPQQVDFLEARDI